jgi:hypothetical protein
VLAGRRITVLRSAPVGRDVIGWPNAVESAAGLYFLSASEYPLNTDQRRKEGFPFCPESKGVGMGSWKGFLACANSKAYSADRNRRIPSQQTGGFRSSVVAVSACISTIGVYSVVSNAPTASAEVSNCTQFGSAGNYFDGMWNSNSPYIGVSSNLVVRYAAVCDTDTSQYNTSTGAIGNFSAAWSMIANAGGEGWLQSGYLRAYAQGDITFSQEYNPYTIGLYTKFQSLVNAGETHHYWQQNSGATY